MLVQRGKADYILLMLFGILLFLGLVFLASASSAIGYQKFSDTFFFVKKQLVGVVVGLFLFFLATKLNYHKLNKWSFLLFVFANILLLLVLIPGLGSNYETNARSWLTLFGQSFQPVELAKIALILYISALIAKMGKNLEEFKTGFLTTLGIGCIPIFLVILQPDIGSVAILFSILFGLLFVGGAKYSHLGGLALVGISLFAIMIIVAPYRAARLTTFLHPELDPKGVGYHINQAFLAIGSGGLVGRGLGHSLQKYQYLPEVHADSIFAIVAEESGFIFSFCFIIFLIALGARGLIVAKNASDDFGRLVASGIIIWFMVQSFMNIGAMVGLMPLTGVPLPFVSHGGSALAIAIGAVGILISISKNN